MTCASNVNLSLSFSQSLLQSLPLGSQISGSTFSAPIIQAPIVWVENFKIQMLSSYSASVKCQIYLASVKCLQTTMKCTHLLEPFFTLTKKSPSSLLIDPVQWNASAEPVMVSKLHVCSFSKPRQCCPFLHSLVSLRHKIDCGYALSLEQEKTDLQCMVAFNV